MAKAAQTVLATDEITFELERFELVDGQIELAGRWFGVRGRRFVRPTLTPLSGRDMSRVLADLEHKPWAPEDGGEWLAAFPWQRNGISVKFELSVAPDIVIRLPSPRAKLTLPRRIAALPRPSIAGPAWPQPQVEQVEEDAGGAAGPAMALEAAAPAPEAEVEVEPIRNPEAEFARELERTRSEHELQLEQARAELEAARAELDAAAAARDAAAGETAAARDAVSAETAATAAMRDELAALQAAHAELEAAYDELANERDRLTTDLATGERTLTELRSELERAAAAVQEATRERDQVISQHGAAMVMRRAAVGGSHPREHSAWREAMAVVALIAVVFVILIVVHVL